MKLAVICFTQNGFKQMKKISSICGSVKSGRTADIQLQCFCKCTSLKEHCESDNEVVFVGEPVDVWAGKMFAEKNALLFIGAAGIAVRAISGSVNNKLSDSPVIVMDDNAKFVIPILSGHVGGANEIAGELAEITGAVPVITTATDVNKKFAVDVFAKKNHLAICNKDGIAKVSSRALAGEEINILVEKGIFSEDKVQGRIPDGVRVEYYDERSSLKTESGESIKTDVYIGSRTQNIKADLYLLPEIYVLGIGCRRGKTREEIRQFVDPKLEELHIDKRQICKVASIDVKKDEAGLIEYVKELGVGFEVFTAEELNALEGDFSESEFVRSKVGVGCVSERAAMAAADKPVLRKQAENGVTLAIAKKDWRLSFYE